MWSYTTKEDKENQLQAWGILHMSGWVEVHEDIDNVPAHDTKLVMRKAVCGFMRVMSRDALGVDLSGGGHAKWVVFMYKDERSTTPFFIVPGCRVDSVQLYDVPFEAGFRETIPYEDNEK